MDTLIEQYVDKMSVKWTRDTCVRYTWYLRHLATWLIANDRSTQPDQITLETLEAWLRDNDHWSPSSRYVAVCAVRGYFRWSVGERKSPARRLKHPRRHRTPQRYLEEEQVLRILEVLDPSTPLGARNTAIILLLLDAGLRASELCGLQVKHLRLNESRLAVRGKGGDWCHIPYSHYTRSVLARWMAYRDRLAAKDAEEVFIGIYGAKPGTRMTRDGLRAVFRRIGERAGFHFSPHDFRRTCGTWMLRSGASTRLVQILLRLKTLALVETYSPGLETADVEPYFPVNSLMQIKRADGESHTPDDLPRDIR